MALKIDIPESLVEPTREIYRHTAKGVWSNLTQAKSDWAELRPVLAQLGILYEFETPPSSLTAHASVLVPKQVDAFRIWDDFQDAKTWLSKAEFVIKLRGASTSSEMVDYIKEKIDPNFDVELARNSLAATLSVAARDGKIKRDKIDGEFVYDIMKK